MVITVNGKRWEGEVGAKETLLDFLRERLNLTGTKCGCRSGDCGACKVLLDGEAVNSCTLLVKNLSGKTVLTIEGLAVGDNLHPVQKAFVEKGAIQCGFCTPGMVIQSVALLRKNPLPTEKEIVEALDNNLCRCTGYKKIIEAVQAAASENERIKVSLERNTPPGRQPETEKSRWQGVGARLPNLNARAKVTGRTKYLSDLRFPDLVYGKILYSPQAHARIRSIDTRAAEALPGVLAVATCLNTPSVLYNSALRYERHGLPADERIFPPVVRYVGDRVAAAAALTPEVAAQALSLIKVDYEVLPAVFDAEEALRPEAPRLQAGGNLVREIKVEAGRVALGMAASAYVFEDRIHTPRPHHLALELHACVAQFDPDGKLTVWSTTQNIFAYRVLLAHIFSLPLHKVRVIKPPSGGAFGGKLEMTIEPVAAVLSQMCSRPVKIELTRRETMVSTRTRHAAVVEIKTGVQKDGRILAQEIKVIANTGAYTSSAINVLSAMGDKAFKQYRIPNLTYLGYPVLTNTPVAGAMRGYGSPQLVLAREIHLDRVAKALHLDPVEFRRRNLVQPGDINPKNGESLGGCYPLPCLEEGAEVFGWADWQSPVLPPHIKRGIGMAVGLHGSGVYPVHADVSTVTIKLNEDGTGILGTGAQDLGQGSDTVLAQIACQILGMDLADWTLVSADTELTPWDVGTYASRVTWVAGQAAKLCAEKIADQIKDKAAEVLKAAKDELRLADHKIISTRGEVLLLKDVVWRIQQEDGRELMATHTHKAAFNAVSYGADFAEVEVDTMNEQVKVLRLVAVHDVGKALNPLLVEGQIEGGVQMGLGYALWEDLKLNASGRVTNPSLKRYRMAKAADMPELTVRLVERGEELGAFGAKSIGECATVPVAPAIVNAVVNAIGRNIDVLPLKGGLKNIRSRY
ncbi:Aldehyde oxidase and xanthine dehydrogenase, a/b hammerhead domain protein [Acididesulfobacillus acetoxydans]|uniref:Aldehyde oxidase and xanthine dehydrogenase, a/b hammerhead domain protein n=1 Tax=Acididesulfobacillus acetoxydans TaxID=1561005 RepID=A0A8S0XBB9_9FIRM|nr:molybdopterin cofactor-binding domain-containing protein [Acididesulfobacillus acetoxydans]CAA7601036.1 Aldehyde oxidase and xanthine dehydrogenase, a/b hammerhead domain protein [Acididesulfobacillus acetoxydans]CEJ06910.1 Xanthine dehydrogenase molybdenum-binding subunit [Acididesulfobacillus acetoxydans]